MESTRVPLAKAPPSIRLLAVEDSPGYLYLIRSAFGNRKGVHWELAVAQDGARALELLLDKEAESGPLPDLILLDWNIPKVNGHEMLRRVKDYPKLRTIPVLVFSASAAETDIYDAYDGYANGYLVKPGDIDVLAQMAETLERFWIAIAQIPRSSGSVGASVKGGPAMAYCDICDKLLSRQFQASTEFHVKSSTLVDIAELGNIALFTSLLEEARRAKSECDNARNDLERHRAESQCGRKQRRTQI